MNPNTLAAIISAASSAAVAITALLLNQRGFAQLDKRIDDLRSDLNQFRADTNHRLDRIEVDLKEFFKVQAEHDKRIQRLEDKQ